jgi:hypothetical protein
MSKVEFYHIGCRRARTFFSPPPKIKLVVYRDNKNAN